MHSRWYQMAVVGLWLTSMTWLVSQKVLPPLLRGEPPSAREVFEAQKRRPLVGWELMLNDRPLGWALSTTTVSSSNLTEIRSRVHIERLPLEKLTPGWVRAMLGLVKHQEEMYQIDTENTVAVDPLGNLVRFDSPIRFGPDGEEIRIVGVVDKGKIRVTVRMAGEVFGPKEYPMSDALLGNSFSPETQLPKLRAGQTWTVRTYNPLKPYNPLEVLQAKVERSVVLSWDGRRRGGWMVVFRRDSGSGLMGGRNVRGRLWVTRDGTVLKQEVVILDAELTFIRLPDEEAVRLQEAVQRAGQASVSLDDLIGQRKGDRHGLCEAPSGPFRQTVPVPLSLPENPRLRCDD